MDLIQAAAVLRTVDDAAWQARVDAARGVDAGAIARLRGRSGAHQRVRQARLASLAALASPAN